MWLCGSDKFPGTYILHFNSSIFRRGTGRIWKTMFSRLLIFFLFLYVRCIHKGCIRDVWNASFITLILIVNNHCTVMSSYREVCLIGLRYKVIVKILAVRRKWLSPLAKNKPLISIRIDKTLMVHERSDCIYERKKKKHSSFFIYYCAQWKVCMLIWKIILVLFLLEIGMRIICKVYS